jgi:hypothetical protein
VEGGKIVGSCTVGQSWGCFRADETAYFCKLLSAELRHVKERRAVVVEEGKKDFRFYFVVREQG